MTQWGRHLRLCHCEAPQGPRQSLGSIDHPTFPVRCCLEIATSASPPRNDAGGKALPYTDVIARPRRGRGNPFPVQAVLPRSAVTSTRAGGIQRGGCMCLQEQTHAPSLLCRFLACFFLAHEGAPPPAAEARERSRETDCHVASPPRNDTGGGTKRKKQPPGKSGGAAFSSDLNQSSIRRISGRLRAGRLRH